MDSVSHVADLEQIMQLKINKRTKEIKENFPKI